MDRNWSWDTNAPTSNSYPRSAGPIGRFETIQHNEPNHNSRVDSLHLGLLRQPNYSPPSSSASGGYLSMSQDLHNLPSRQPSASAPVPSIRFAQTMPNLPPTESAIQLTSTRNPKIQLPQPPQLQSVQFLQHHQGIVRPGSSAPDLHGLSSTTGVRKPRQSGPRRLATSLPDWEIHRQEIEKLYINQNLPLAEVREIMAKDHGFTSSDKLYKKKLDEWGFIKNIPKRTAMWVLKKDKERRNKGKKTAYQLGGKPLKIFDFEKRAKRIKPEEVAPVIDSQTPKHLTYFTPNGEVVITPKGDINLPPTPGSTEVVQAKWTPPSVSDQSVPEAPRSSQDGHTLADLANLQEDARNLARLEQTQAAENMFREVLKALVHLLSPTHEETSTVAYELADFYAKNERKHDADAVLDWLGREHIQCWGCEHQKTANHVERVMQLYQKWSRLEESVELLNRTFGTSQTLPVYGDEKANSSDQLSKARTIFLQKTMSGIGEQPLNSSNFARQLEKAKHQVRHVHADAEPILLHLISRYDNNQQEIPMSQLFDAKCTLADLYQRRLDFDKLYPALTDAQDTFEKALVEKAEDLGITLKSSVRLINLFINSGYKEIAESILQKVEKSTKAVVDEEENDFVDILIALGKLYQEQKKWNKASLHFQHALAISMRIHRLDCRIVRVLESALENENFDPSSITFNSMKLEFRKQGFERCGCGGLMGEFGTRF